MHLKGREFEPKALTPMTGPLDLYLVASIPPKLVVEQLTSAGVEIVEGSVLRAGVTGRIRAIYVRDPDLNLFEVSEVVD